MTAAADQTVYRLNPRRDGRTYFTWEQSETSSRSPRRRSSSLPPPERPSPIFDVAASSSRVGQLLCRRLTDVWRRSRRHRDRPTCKTTATATAISTSSRRARSTAGSTTRQHSSADRRPLPDAMSAVTQLTWLRPWMATRPTTTLTTATARGHATITMTVTRSSRNTVTSTASLREQFMSFFQVSDNKLAMKLFGNKNALEKEKLRHRAVGHWVIHPCSDFRFYSTINVHIPFQAYVLMPTGWPEARTPSLRLP